jgi:hypothetical protein
LPKFQGFNEITIKKIKERTGAITQNEGEIIYESIKKLRIIRNARSIVRKQLLEL